MEINETVILLAEDQAIVRNLIRLMLSKEGYIVLTVNDGEEAVEVCQSFSHAIHLLLTDFNMPGINGMELAKRIQAQRPEIKTVVMSGEMTATILEKNTADAFLKKPFIPPTLLRCVQQVLAGQFRGVCEDVAVR